MEAVMNQIFGKKGHIVSATVFEDRLNRMKLPDNLREFMMLQCKPLFDQVVLSEKVIGYIWTAWHQFLIKSVIYEHVDPSHLTNKVPSIAKALFMNEVGGGLVLAVMAEQAQEPLVLLVKTLSLTPVIKHDTTELLKTMFEEVP